MMRKFLRLKNLWLISLLVFIAFSCKTNKNQTQKFPEVEVIEEVELDLIQPDTFSGELPKTLEMEMSKEGNEFFEVRHESQEQEIVDSIKNQKNKIKKKNR